MQAALSALVREECFIKAHRLIRIIDEKAPALVGMGEVYRPVIEVNRRRTLLAMAAAGFIGVCILLSLTNKGYRRAFRSIADHRRFFLVFIPAVFAYLYLYYALVVVRDIERQFDLPRLLAVYAQCLVLIPLSLAIRGALSSATSRWLNTLVPWLFAGLLGACSWIVFAYYYDYLWIIGL